MTLGPVPAQMQPNGKCEAMGFEVANSKQDARQTDVQKGPKPCCSCHPRVGPMIEDEEGCYIQGLGYFCFITERFQRKQKSIFLKYNVSNGYFFPDSHCKGLYMEETCFEKPCSYRKYAPNFKLTQTMSEQLQSHKEIVTKINRSRYIDEFN